MLKREDRRCFLGRAALLAAGATGGLLARRVRAIEPIRRTAGPKFKFSLAGYSYRALLTGNPPELKLEDFIRDCAKMDLEGSEPTSYYFPKGFDRDYLRDLKHLTFRLGLDISGTAVSNDFCLPHGPERDRHIAHVKQWIDYAEILGAPVIRIFSGRPRGSQTRQEAHKLAVEAIEQCCEHAGRHGVFLALENHGGLSVPVESMLRLVRDVRSPWFGVNLDSGNFASDDPYGDLEKIAPYALNVQVKVTIAGPGGRRVPTDFGRLARMLAAAGYRGYVVLEYEGKQDPRVACPQYVERIREAFNTLAESHG